MWRGWFSGPANQAGGSLQVRVKNGPCAKCRQGLGKERSPPGIQELAKTGSWHHLGPEGARGGDRLLRARWVLGPRKVGHPTWYLVPARQGLPGHSTEAEGTGKTSSSSFSFTAQSPAGAPLSLSSMKNQKARGPGGRGTRGPREVRG